MHAALIQAIDCCFYAENMQLEIRDTMYKKICTICIKYAEDPKKMATNVLNMHKICIKYAEYAKI